MTLKKPYIHEQIGIINSNISDMNENISLLTEKSNHFIDLKSPPSPLVGAKGDGTDETTVIQNILNNIPAGSVLYIPNGTYKISNYLTLTKKITIIGYGTTFKFTDTPSFGSVGYCFIYANGVSNITIEGLSFDGNKSVVPKYATSNTAVWLEDCYYAKIINCIAYNLQGLGTNLNTAFAFVDQSHYSEAIGNTVYDSNCGAIFMQGSGSKMTNNSGYNLEDIAFVFNSASCYGSVMSGNYARNCLGGAYGVENGCYDITISNNSSFLMRGYGVAVIAIGSEARSKNIVISNNVIDGNGSYIGVSNAIAVLNCDDYIVSDNIIKNYTDANVYNAGIVLRGNNFIAANNNITVDCYGISCIGTYVNINNNRITSNSLYGIYFADDTAEVNCSGNIINSDNTGIARYSTKTVSGNFISNRITATNGKKYALGNVGKSSFLKIMDSSLTGFGSLDMVKESGIYTFGTPITVAAGAISGEIALDIGASKPWVDTVSWCNGSADAAGSIASFTRWANGGQTAVFKVTNQTSSSITVNKIYYNAYGQKTEVSTY